VLAVHAPNTVRRAVATGDVTTLTRVPGIGKKGAERLILELKDRIGTVGGGDEPARTAEAEPAWRSQVRQGLVGLGWSVKEAEDAAAAVAADAGDQPDVATLLKQAIRMLGRR
jgi:Holliday junction DNA helicase RuvA